MRSFDAPSAHRGMWLAETISPDTPNHALIMWDVPGRLDPAAMRSTFCRVVDEMEVLRLTFVAEGDEVRLLPRERGDWQPFHWDLRDQPDPEAAARAALHELLARPFVLDTDIALRLGVIELTPHRTLVVIAYHHLVSDGFGAGGVLSRRIAEIYTAMAEGSPVPGPAHSWDAASFVAATSDYAASPRFAADATFWEDHLRDAPAPSHMPRIALDEVTAMSLTDRTTDVDRWAELADAIGMRSRTLTVPRSEAVRWMNTAASMGVWMSSFIAGAVAVQLRHRCGDPDVLYSLAIANRSGQARHTPGLTVNVVPVRTTVSLDTPVRDVAEAVVDGTAELLDHAAFHYSDIRRAAGAGLNERGSFGPVVNVVEFVEQVRFGDHPATYLGATTGSFNELSIGVYTDGSADSDLYLRLDAPATSYSSPELAFIGRELLSCIRSIVDDPDQRVGSVSLTVDPGSADLPVPETPASALPLDLIDRRIIATPDAPAVTSATDQLTYRELDERADRVAAALQRRGVGPETVVAVLTAPSSDFVVAVLGVLRAGAAYRICDEAGLRAGASHPGAEPVVTVSCTAHSPWPPGDTQPTDGSRSTAVALVDLLAEPAGRTRAERSNPHGAACVVAHRGDVVALTRGNLAAALAATGHREPGWRPALGGRDPSDPALIHALWEPLCHGGPVIVSDDADRAHLDARAVSSLLGDDRPQTTRRAGIRVGGAARIPPTLIQRLHHRYPDVAVVSGYGTAETTGARPRAGSALVLGPDLRVVLPGVTGELYVAGPDLARGYIGGQCRTAASFVACPYGPPGERMYRTGERARWAPDGRLELRGPGRIPVVRGLRTETADIEDVIAGHTGVSDVAVVGRPDDAGGDRLVAYLCLDTGRTTLDAVRRSACEQITSHPVPSEFVVLPSLPETVDGRLDIAALPEPDQDGPAYRAPRDGVERALTAAFAEALERDRVGIDDDFFDLGGNSLRAIRLVGLIRADLERDVSIRSLFAARTVAALSETWHSRTPQSRRPALQRRTRDGRLV